MSGIKRTIDNLYERAQAGNQEAIQRLCKAGLWQDRHRGSSRIQTTSRNRARPPALFLTTF